MRLIECHVEGFGKIVDKIYKFDQKISSFCFENGHGKTTLSAFIRAMLYGLDSVKSNSKNFEDRLHYLPFSGAKFGGSLTVSEGGAEYRIERFFDKKSRVKDTLKVYKNSRETDEFGDAVGEKLLGIDKESFERTLFANAKDEFFGSTEGINAKLNNFSSGEENSATALTVLEKAKRSIRAAKGSNDLLSKAENNLRELNSQIKNLESLSDEVGSLYKKREDLTARISLLEEAQRADTKKQIRASVISSYKRLSEEVDARCAARDAILSQYEKGLPSGEEIAKIRALSAEATAKESALSAASFASGTKKRLDELNEIFKSYLPKEADVLRAEETARELERISEKIATSEKATRELGEKKISLPTEDEIADKKLLLSEYKEVRAEIENLASDSAPKKSRAKTPLLAAGIILAAASIPFAFILLPVFFILLVAGGALCFLSVLRQTGSSDAAVRLAQLRVKAEHISESIKLFLAKYGFFTESGIVFDFSRLEAAFLNRQENEKEYEIKRADLEDLKNKQATLSSALSKFFASLGYPAENPYRAISEIRGLLSERAALVGQKNEAASTLSSLREDLSRIYAERDALLDAAGISREEFSIDALAAMARDRQALDFETAELSKVKKQRDLFRSEKNITEEELAPQNDSATDSFSADELDFKRRELASLDREISEIEERVQLLPEKQNALELAEEKIASLKKQLTVITKTQEFIAKAEENLLEKFVGPVLNKFKDNLSELSEITGERFTMDLGFNLKFEEAGEMRDEKHLSAGQRAVVDLALRLALADALFGDGEQFIILDDPFVSLDETYMKKTRAYLESASKTRQIVYFCCHNSRKI